MKKVVFKKIFLSLAIPSGIIGIVMYANSTNIDYSNNVIKNISKVKDTRNYQVTNALLASEYNETRYKTVHSIDLSELDILNDKLSMDQTQLAEHITILEEEHKTILKKMRKKGYKIGKVAMMSPKLKLILSLYLDVSPSNLSTKELDQSRLSSTDLYYLNLLADSNDLRILLANNELTQEFLQIKNLKRLYGRNEVTFSL